MIEAGHVLEERLGQARSWGLFLSAMVKVGCQREAFGRNIRFVHRRSVRQFRHQSQIPQTELADPSPQALLFGGVIWDVFEAVKCGALLGKAG
jgi:hypothetical protein